jgi:hypothetical protein
MVTQVNSGLKNPKNSFILGGSIKINGSSIPSWGGKQIYANNKSG